MVNCLSSAYWSLLLSSLLALEHQYADAFQFVAHPLFSTGNAGKNTNANISPSTYQLYASSNKGFGSTNNGTVGKSKKKKIQKEAQHKKGFLEVATDSSESIRKTTAETAEPEPTIDASIIDLTSMPTTSQIQSAQTTANPIMAAYELTARAKEMQSRGQLNGAVTAFADALALQPTTTLADRRFLLAMALEENGEPKRAVDMYELACDANDADFILQHDAAIKVADLWANDLGNVETAIQYIDKAINIDASDYDHTPLSDAAAMDQKAFYLAEQGDLVEAIRLWEAAITATNELVANSTASADLDEDTLSRAVARSHLGLFFRGVAKKLLRHNPVDVVGAADFAALPVNDEYDCQYMVDSWEYIAKNTAANKNLEQPQTWEEMLASREERITGSRLFTGPHTMLKEALDAARPDGLVCEFGVFHGKSIRLLAEMVNDPLQLVEGFDTFEGIPEAWGAENPKGTYTAAAELPQRVPDNVRFHVGLFSETLPGYVATLEENEASSNVSTPITPVRLINVDCDLYQGTVEILHYLANRIGPGTVIVFDEYLMTRTWPEDEYKAFQEACTLFGWEYEYLSFSLFSKQAVVRITASKSFVGRPV